jgi:CelD/BcsL family acetyltransferase involved in cellulose biosynthesis
MEFNVLTHFPVELAPAWDALLQDSIINVPFLKFQYQQLWWESRGAGEWSRDCELLLITAHEAGQLIGAAPLFRTPQGELRLVGSVEISDFLGFLVRQADVQRFVDGLFTQLLAMPWQSITLDNLLDDSPLLAALHQAAASHALTVQQENQEVAPAIVLDGDWETYLSGVNKKQRHEIRRKMRRAEESEWGVKFRLVQQAEKLPQSMQDVFRLMRFDEQKAIFLTPGMEALFTQVAQWAFDEGILNLAFLDVNGQAAACNLSLDYDEQIWLYNSGVSSEYQDLSLGWVILGNLIQWCTQNGKKRFDFMRGDEEYKYRFGAQNRQLVQIKINR